MVRFQFSILIRERLKFLKEKLSGQRMGEIVYATCYQVIELNMALQKTRSIYTFFKKNIVIWLI